MTSSPVNFQKPPVIEVVFGVAFKPLEQLLAPHLGLLWRRYRDEFPSCRDMPPLPVVIERYGPPVGDEMEVFNVPPLPRVWFEKGESRLIQLQRDRFLYNWRKGTGQEDYPRYETVLAEFRKHLATFEAGLGEAGLGVIQPVQYELTYVDQMNIGEGWNGLGEIGKLFPDFSWRHISGRSLKEPEAINLRVSFAAPDRTGRLHVWLRSAIRRADNKLVLLMETTARGMPADGSREGMWRWFDMGHEQIRRGFLEMSSAYAQDDLWRKGP
ncbi:MAG: TIGR04255 family protein [Planctomycetota bacterium]|nr:TIGR04255 family protein [Planctomycetota bacterium]